ncbi:MAG TPA: DNA polymerase III subunit gamma/tau [Bacteroidia bacterium]|nr:DNA polymerase III subunit gamma/tau [Bacteroidia bacterium]
MNEFVVSARKYRPATFDTVIGQAAITTTLKNAIKSKHLAQSFLFCGPRGVGKTTCARILAKTINCTNLSENTEACNKCESCVSFDNNQSFNIYELDAASNNSVEDIRSLVEQVRFPPQLGKYKIYIIDEVHMLSAAAFNAFLKTLEEPPSYAIFILATTEKHKIIPTILSRCQIFDFNRIKVDDIAKHLEWISEQENVTAEPDALHIIAQKADGALRDALSTFDQIVSFAGNKVTYKDVINNLHILDYDYYFRITDDILAGNLSSILLTFNELLSDGFDGHHFINGLSSHFRDLLVCTDSSTLQLLEVSKNIKEKYKKQSQQTPSQLLFHLLDISNKCDVEYRSSKNQRLHVEIALMKMCRLQMNSTSEKKTEDQITLKNIPANPVADTQKSSLKKPDEIKTAAAPPSPVQEIIPVIEKPQLTSTAKTPSIKLPSATKITEERKEAENKVNEPLPASYEDINFTPGELQEAWSEYAKKVSEAGRKQLFSTMNKRKPELKDNFIIEITVDNKMQADELFSEQISLLPFLKKKLRNTQIKITSAVIELKARPDEAYTPKEKFMKMAEKNPALDTLRKQFDLEF